ncbi:hypothetical protein T492DRAFT_866761 [Pavlovales sp. CCMP2436]|nr:hypothetical protein T492DRAFT_866761 [Pavlovales sp. CCMP2436]
MGHMGLFSFLPKAVPPPSVVKAATAAQPAVQPVNRALKALPAPDIIKTAPPIAFDAVRVPTISAKNAAIGLMAGSGALLLLGGGTLRSAISRTTGFDLPMLQGPGNLIAGITGSIQEALAAAAGIAVTCGAAYICWGALANVSLVRRASATVAVASAVGLAMAVTLEDVPSTERLRGKYNLTELSAWKALERNAQLHAEALSSITSAVIETEKRPAGVENASRFDPEPCTGMLATIERVVTEVGSALFLLGLIHLAWTTHERLREPPPPAPVEKPWAPTPLPGFSVVAAEQDEDGHERDSQCDRADEAGIALLGDDTLGADVLNVLGADGLLQLERQRGGWDAEAEVDLGDFGQPALDHGARDWRWHQPCTVPPSYGKRKSDRRLTAEEQKRAAVLAYIVNEKKQPELWMREQSARGSRSGAASSTYGAKASWPAGFEASIETYLMQASTWAAIANPVQPTATAPMRSAYVQSEMHRRSLPFQRYQAVLREGEGFSAGCLRCQWLFW